MSVRLEAYTHALALSGQLIYETDWYLLIIPDHEYAPLAALLATLAVAYKAAARPHISVAKAEAPCRNQADWGHTFVGEAIWESCMQALLRVC